MSQSFTIALLPGDGVGPEVLDAGRRLLEAAAAPGTVRFTEHVFGGAAINAENNPLPEKTLQACREADAVFMGAAGGPEWAERDPSSTPEAGILRLRRELGLFANIRPIQALADESDVDFVIVRELTGGIYYGRPREYADSEAFNTMRYTRPEIERIARIGFDYARRRDGRLVSVDKANVLEVSRLWRETVVGLRADEYPDISLDHLYVDNAAMQVAREPGQFDVMLTGNLFGDILSDLAGTLVGSLGVLPSASLGGSTGVFEPVHGSAPDIAGRDTANPVGAILSAAMLLDELGAADAASRIRRAVQQTVQDGFTTSDMGGTEGCSSMTSKILDRLAENAAAFHPPK